MRTLCERRSMRGNRRHTQRDRERESESKRRQKRMTKAYTEAAGGGKMLTLLKMGRCCNTL